MMDRSVFWDGTNPDHLKKLKEGVSVWNEWRQSRADSFPRPFSTCDLAEADPDLRALDLRGADFSSGNLTAVKRGRSDLRAASFRGSNLASADFSQANLEGADLSGCELEGTNFSWAQLQRAVFDGSRFSRTILARVDLSAARGLDQVVHRGPSTLGIDALVLSRGRIPESFLRGCGIPDTLIAYSHALTNSPLILNSCFISYSNRDQEFAEKLYSDLQRQGVRVWLATRDLPVGAKIRDGIEEAIHFHDRLLLVLSSSSIESSWVEKEVETAFDKEARQKRIVLFPIRIDSSAMESTRAWVADIRRQRNIGDFTNWMNAVEYNVSLNRLLAALKGPIPENGPRA